MPESVSFVVTTYTKLAKGETGITNMSSVRLTAAQAFDWILSELPDDALNSSEPGIGVDVITIDWNKVPQHVRNPKLPARRR